MDPRRVPASLMVLVLALLLLVPGPAGAADADRAVFETPSAEGALGEPVVYRGELRSPVEPVRVELLTHLPDVPVALVRQVTPTRGDGDRWTMRLEDTSHISPNSTIAYRFRAVLPDGSVATSEERSITIEDRRFDWRSRSDGGVTLHWYQGGDAFAERALRIGSDAVERASALLGVTDMPPVDFFVYATEDDLYEALGPGTRENVGGQANADIRTMFGLIGPGEVGSDWVDILVTHELTHLVFHEAVDNPYHFPPRWLNEGLAVWLSQGYDQSDRSQVERAAANGSLIPLTGLGGLFPTQRARFSLAYAESVSAVEYLIRTHGEATLARLITSYAAGVTDDEAFQAAIGMTMAEFDDAWMASLGAGRPEPYGPRPAPPGTEPAGWSASPAP
jgi:hypothetical protein